MSDVLVTQAGPILEVLLNRPDKKNALTGAMYAAVAEAFRHANADASVRVVLLSGAGIRSRPATTLKIFKAGWPRMGRRTPRRSSPHCPR
jgi:1,4-dihydroxy-2-naphthoyl-CoA synthase